MAKKSKTIRTPKVPVQKFNDNDMNELLMHCKAAQKLFGKFQRDLGNLEDYLQKLEKKYGGRVAALDNADFHKMQDLFIKIEQRQDRVYAALRPSFSV